MQTTIHLRWLELRQRWFIPKCMTPLYDSTWNHQLKSKAGAPEATANTYICLHWGGEGCFLLVNGPSQYFCFTTARCSTLIQVIYRCGRQHAPCSVPLVSDSSPGLAIVLVLSLSPAVSLLDHTVVTRDTRSTSKLCNARVANLFLQIWVHCTQYNGFETLGRWREKLA